MNMNEVGKHDTRQDCWVVIHGSAYDLTSFLDEHPGGSAIILKYAGKDATKAFDSVHPLDIIEKLLSPDLSKGPVSDAPSYKSASEISASQSQVSAAVAFKPDLNLPPLDAILNLTDFEACAQQLMSKDGWAYYSSAADDEVTARENRLAYHRIWMKPRVMVNVKDVSVKTSILGYDCSLPVYVTATALGRLGHPEGEVVLTRAAASHNVIQMIPTLASCSLDEITLAAQPGQVQFFQLYVNSNRAITQNLVKKAERLGCKALFITVDAPTLAKREKDMRMKYIRTPPKVQEGHQIQRSQGAARAIGSFIDPSLCWEDLKWFRSITNLPIVLKGVQCAEDALLAAQHGVQGIVISNHGGRQLDFARSSIEILPEVMDLLDKHGLRDKMEVYVDGGIRRGTDIFKAIALGAKAVGIGRPLLYAMSTYGQPGVEHALQILKDELEMVCRLMGVTDIRKASPQMLCLNSLNQHTTVVPKDYLTDALYQRMQPPLQPSRSEVKSKSKL
ncbi:hypothetical protein MIR68_010180 [Amoeboaphelidium protococcarum]|nr:hypothetical protein MIR68_010180 [Amoeboaphelidium protococcarum]